MTREEVKALIREVLREDRGQIGLTPNLASFRLFKGMSVDLAARSAGMSRAMLYRYEGGRVRTGHHVGVVDHLRRLARVYGITFDQAHEALRQSIDERLRFEERNHGRDSVRGGEGERDRVAAGDRA